MNDPNERPNDVTPLASDDLLSLMDHKRGMYFCNWLMREWLSDPDGLEHVSVKDIIEKYANTNGTIFTT